jgi:hypothetical protein
MLKRFAMALAFTGLLAGALLIPDRVSASNHLYVNDFEMAGDDTAAGGWTFNPATAPIVRTPSGYTNAGGYADGIGAAHGQWHARLKSLGCNDCTGPATNWGTLTTTTFPPGGYVTEIDIYLDVDWTNTPTNKVDRRFDWSSAINNNLGLHKRDFVFNAGTDSQLGNGFQPGFFINASTNATRSGAFPQNTCPNPSVPGGCRTPVHITDSGWYTFEHTFYDNGGFLAVDMKIYEDHRDTLVASWTVQAGNSDPISMVGGDRYGWFAIEEIPDLAADCAVRRPPELTDLQCPPNTPGKVTGGGRIEPSSTTSGLDAILEMATVLIQNGSSPASVGSKATFGFSVNCCPAKGNLEYNDHGADVRIKATSVDGLSITDSTPLVCTGGQHAQFRGNAKQNGTPVTYTVDVDDCGEPGSSPGSGPDRLKIQTSAGYMAEGPLVGGNIQIHKD